MIMKLTVNCFNIGEVRFDSNTYIDDGVLYIDRKELKNLVLDSDFFKDVEIHIVNPGDSVRIIKVNDVIEPRAKSEHNHSDFPGCLGRITTAGSGTTLALKGVGVVLIDQMPKRAIEFIDMSGRGAELSIYGKMHNVVVNPIPLDGLAWADYQYASKIAALRTSVYLAGAARSSKVDEVRSYDLTPSRHRSLQETGDLPRIAYYFQMHVKQFASGVKEPIFYGHNLEGFLPTIVHPNEIMDGAVLRGFTGGSMETYTIQNNAVIESLYARHRKELLFVGTVIGVSSVDEVERERAAVIIANLASNVLGADGIILTKAYGGAAHADIERAAELCEERGVKTALLIQILTEEKCLEEAVIINSNKLDGLVNTGFFGEKVTLPSVEEMIGGSPSDLIEGEGPKGQVTARLRLLTGATSQLGGSGMIAAQY